MLVNKINDINLINRLDKLCFDDFYSIDILKTLDKNHSLYVFETNNEIIGFVILNNFYENEYELIKIGILKEYRCKGYAKKGLEILLSKINWSKIFLEVDAKNYSAIQLYNKLGFSFINKREKYYKNGNDALIFVKENI